MGKPAKNFSISIYRNGVRFANGLTKRQFKRRILGDAARYSKSPEYTIVCYCPPYRSKESCVVVAGKLKFKCREFF
jgi:hypothetical protein